MELEFAYGESRNLPTGDDGSAWNGVAEVLPAERVPGAACPLAVIVTRTGLSPEVRAAVRRELAAACRADPLAAAHPPG